MDPSHHNSSSLENCHYNLGILKHAITIVALSDSCHFLRILTLGPIVWLRIPTHKVYGRQCVYGVESSGPLRPIQTRHTPGDHHLSRVRPEERGRHLTLVARRVTGAVTRRDEGKAGAPGADPPCRGVPCRGRSRKSCQSETKGKPLPFTPPTPTPPAPVRP